MLSVPGLDRSGQQQENEIIGSLPKNDAALDTRRRIREGSLDAPTAGVVPGNLQGNVVILPGEVAGDFESFCRRNPKPCPLLAVSDRGDPELASLGNIDIRTDVPLYRVFRHGRLVSEVIDIVDLWREDLVTFVLGCSLSFEKALSDEGVPVRHLELNTLVPMFRSSIATIAAGQFRGQLVVTMRPVPEEQVDTAVGITSRYPYAHGAPVHIGSPEDIGIGSLDQPAWGGPVPVHEGEVPLFWACGVTPQLAIENARPELCITHAPGHMLVTDLFAEPVDSTTR